MSKSRVQWRLNVTKFLYFIEQCQFANSIRAPVSLKWLSVSITQSLWLVRPLRKVGSSPKMLLISQMVYHICSIHICNSPNHLSLHKSNYDAALYNVIWLISIWRIRSPFAGTILETNTGASMFKTKPCNLYEINK